MTDIDKHLRLARQRAEAIAANLKPDGLMSRRFVLNRNVDVHGVSGTGVVADGVMFPDGRCALRWRSSYSSTACWDAIDELAHVHSHGGDGYTWIEWIDQ